MITIEVNESHVIFENGYFTKQKSSIHKPTLEYIKQDCYWSKTNSKYWSFCDAAIYFNLFPYKTLPPLIYPD